MKRTRRYVPGTFKGMAETPLGEKVWEFLSSEENVLRLVTASELGRPAVEGVAARLEEEFGPEIAGDRWKQVIGHMTRQLVEEEGFQMDAQGVRVRQGTMFSKASRYRLTAAEMVMELQQRLTAIREKASRHAGARAVVEQDLRRASDLWISARMAHPLLKNRLDTVVNTHERCAPQLRIRVLRSANS